MLQLDVWKNLTQKKVQMVGAQAMEDWPLSLKFIIAVVPITLKTVIGSESQKMTMMFWLTTCKILIVKMKLFKKEFVHVLMAVMICFVRQHWINHAMSMLQTRLIIKDAQELTQITIFIH
jgi:chromate transport protein ChrA